MYKEQRKRKDKERNQNRAEKRIYKGEKEKTERVKGKTNESLHIGFCSK